jgi:hypothetical protein
MLYEVIAYVVPGLTKSERRFLAPIVFGSSILFYAGCVAFARVVAVCRRARDHTGAAGTPLQRRLCSQPQRMRAHAPPAPVHPHLRHTDVTPAPRLRHTCVTPTSHTLSHLRRTPCHTHVTQTQAGVQLRDSHPCGAQLFRELRRGRC